MPDTEGARFNPTAFWRITLVLSSRVWSLNRLIKAAWLLTHRPVVAPKWGVCAGLLPGCDGGPASADMEFLCPGLEAPERVGGVVLLLLILGARDRRRLSILEMASASVPGSGVPPEGVRLTEGRSSASPDAMASRALSTSSGGADAGGGGTGGCDMVCGVIEGTRWESVATSRYGPCRYRESVPPVQARVSDVCLHFHA